MLDLGAIEAILAIPGALQSSRDLLTRSKPDVPAVLSHLDQVRTKLVEFSDVGSWFAEVKDLHQNLQSVSIALGPADRCYMKATAEGFFNTTDYSLGVARESWETTKPHSLNRLIDSFGAMRFIKERAPLETESGLLRRIPRWGLRTVQLKSQIDLAFNEIDCSPPGSADQVRKAAIGLKELSDHIKLQMLEADREFRDRATAISKALETLARDLKHG